VKIVNKYSYFNLFEGFLSKLLIIDDVMPLPDVEKVVEESDVEHKFNTIVRLKNGKLIGLKSAKRIADCNRYIISK
jgi:hypothetical protein